MLTYRSHSCCHKIAGNSLADDSDSTRKTHYSCAPRLFLTTNSNPKTSESRLVLIPRPPTPKDVFRWASQGHELHTGFVAHKTVASVYPHYRWTDTSYCTRNYHIDMTIRKCENHILPRDPQMKMFCMPDIHLGINAKSNGLVNVKLTKQ